MNTTATFTREEVGDIIRKMIDAFGENAWFINNGWCYGFALGLAKKLGPDAKIADSLFKYPEGTFPGHYWVEYRGLHFDAETPGGEDDPRQMQYHRRLRAIADSPDEQDEMEAVIEALGQKPFYYGRKGR
jgi:hypothetical protein